MKPTARNARRLRVGSGAGYRKLQEFLDKALSLLRLATGQPPLQLSALSGHLFKRADKTFHLGLFPDRNAHVIWQSGE